MIDTQWGVNNRTVFEGGMGGALAGSCTLD